MNDPKNTGRLALGLGLAGLLVALLGLALIAADARTAASSAFYVIDPETGVIVDIVPSDQRSTAIAGQYAELIDRLPALLAVGWAGLALTRWGLRRREWSTGLRLRRLAAPLLLPIGATLSVAMALTYAFDGMLEWLLDHLTQAGAVLVGMCMRSLSGCSLLHGHELMRVAAFGVFGLSVALLIPAAREAWRAGLRGRQLSRCGSVAAIICFCVGSVAFVSTRMIREDHRQTLVQCGAGKPWPRHPERDYDVNASSTELQAPPVHEPRPYEEFGVSRPYMNAYQIFAGGELSELPFPTGRSSIEESLERVGLSNEALEAELYIHFTEFYEDDQVRGVYLYVDERVSLARMHELLDVARTAGASEVILLGEARFERSLPSIGSWVRRVYAPHARIQLRDGDKGFADFATWRQLSDMAASRGPAGLALHGD